MSDERWNKIAVAAQSAGLRVTLGLFALGPNRGAERYCSSYGEPRSEAVDAVVVPDRAQSRCPTNGALHREVV